MSTAKDFTPLPARVHLRSAPLDLIKHLCPNPDCEGAYGAPFGIWPDEEPKCPKCGGPALPAATSKDSPGLRSLPVPERTPIPTEFAKDPVLAKLLARQRSLPQEIRLLEEKVTATKAQRKAAAEFLGTMRVRMDAGVARQQDVDVTVDALEEAEIAQREAESALDAAVAARRAIGDLIIKTYEDRRATLAPQTTAAARKFVAEITPHLEAIERIAAKAEVDGLRFDNMFGDTSAAAHRWHTHKTGVPINVLRFFAVPAGHGGRRSILYLITLFRKQVARLGEGA
jgi:hypothetical protein